MKALGDIMAEMAQDIGDMMGPDAVASAHRLQRMVYLHFFTTSFIPFYSILFLL